MAACNHFSTSEQPAQLVRTKLSIVNRQTAATVVEYMTNLGLQLEMSFSLDRYGSVQYVHCVCEYLLHNGHVLRCELVPVQHQHCSTLAEVYHCLY